MASCRASFYFNISADTSTFIKTRNRHERQLAVRYLQAQIDKMLFRKIKILILFFLLNGIAFGQKDSLGLDKCIKTPDVYNDQIVYRTAEKMPEFEGGINQFYKYVIKNVHYTCTDGNNHKSTIHTTFIIDTLGQVQNVCTITTDSRLNADQKQIQDIIKNSPLWTPGKQNGKNVCVRLTVPMRICLK